MPTIDKFSLGLGVAAGIAAAGVLVLLRRKKAKPIAADLTVYYWPMKGRAGSVIRILRAAGVPFTHKSEFSEIAGVGGAFGAKDTTCFAPPIVVNGDVMVSQSTAACMYVGRLCGFDEGMDEDKAPQLMSDLIDTFENGIGKAAMEGGAALKIFLEGKGDGKPSRFAMLMGNLERNVKGPFFFGSKPTPVDFMLTALTDWQDEGKMDRLKVEKGFDPWAAYPKVAGVVAGVRALDPGTPYPFPTVMENYKAKDALFEAYK